ncbi:lysophospholipase L1-like esterase [Fontibacillus solani]|uniref:Lysophospholipase L1-like esterase n=1 Tax=Fontibacillus solani TaxID=1572857 RepID=A0A7W3XUH7_9BACL|nr:SGNH/GDSL hydrolase family protein [Fontibacillus solani]MBA9088641.1 lysophospholipase L1-like esterase [Fontibacillus solani]
MSRYPWRHNTSEDIANQRPSQWETPAGAQEKANQAEQNAKDYTDAHSEVGAEVNQNAYSVVNGIQATSKTDSIDIEAGTGIIVTPVPLEKKVRITAGGTSIPGLHGAEHVGHGADPIPNATLTDSGLMSAADKNELVYSRGTFPELPDRLNDFDTQLADFMYLGLASRYGVDPSIGTADATALLNDYFAALKAKGLKYAYFDKPHTYNVSGVLTNARDLILLGNATIKSSNLDNYYVQICNTQQHYNGKYNTKIYNPNMFTTLKSAITTGVVNVCVWGDSISTGSDCLGISYGNNVPFSNWAPDGLTPSDSYYKRLIDLLTTQFPNVTFNFYNRAIGGTNIQMWKDPQTFNGVGKWWVDHVAETNADLLIVAFGMNNGSIESGREFAYNMKQINDYINANFTKKPSMAWMTAPRSALTFAYPWGSAAVQFGRDLAAYAAREYGKTLGHYVIDVGRVSNIKRTGKDFENPILKSLAVTDTEISAIVTGNYLKNGSEYTISTDGHYINFPVGLKDFVFEFDAKFPTGMSNGGENIWLAFNQFSRGTAQETVSLIFPKHSGGKGAINIFNNLLDMSHWPGSDTYYEAAAGWDDNTFRTFRVEKRRDLLEISVNGVRVYRGRAQINNIPGAFEIRKNSSVGTAFVLKNFKIYQGTYRQYVPTLTDTEMWGPYIADDFNTKPGIGGNGVNHPSTIGIQEVYCTALQEFVDDLASV